MSAKALSEAIRAKRKKLKEGGVEAMVDTAAAPQMNAGNVLLNKQTAQWQETMKPMPDKSSAPSDPADEQISGTSQDKSDLKKKMARVGRILTGLSIG